ncbi:unnamed protein product [Periconia digitata]|uniref:KANL3/Tex30 alpha/beta hydrolase-like domain-containing protein n=1 Tax=Periconia digitata TaxID=1303443 RepID=A0A9W4UFE4_9PLEO|nr:unnamed protein product [Periconia digitata]
MPPKRKIPESSASDAPQQPTAKRATRSSARIKPQVQSQSVETSVQSRSKNIPKNPKRKIETAKKPNKQTVKDALQSQPHPSPPSQQPASDIFSTLEITDNSLKKPILCHHYHAPASPPSQSLSSTTKATCIFTHGAGGTISTPAVRDFCAGYARTAPVLVFQGSANLAARVKAFHACLSHVQSSEATASKIEPSAKKGAKRDENGGVVVEEEEEEEEEEAVILGGRSMGSRAAVMAAGELLSISPSSTSASKPTNEVVASPIKVSLILVSYPLRGPKNDLSDQILLDLPTSVRVLFVVGDRDAMCPLDLLERTRKKMTAESKLVVVKGADHGMHVRPKEMEMEFGEETGRLAAVWVAGEMQESVVHVGGDEEE